MRKLLFISITVLFFANSFAAPVLEPVKLPKLNAKNIFIPIGKTDVKISLMELSSISMDKMQSLTGRKMSFIEKISFKITQTKLKNSIAGDGTIKNKKFEKLFQKKGGETGFHFGGFALGFFLGIIGVIIAYLIHDDYKSNRVKWAWIGFAIQAVIGLISILAGA